ncbi:MAG: N-(5'-phosphoribosyl)anthranilate isomerase, partial [Pseudolabrys sp.]|nr:N-(5'-phosphoribosyl)anthranilate isomerase [Pseudolabrys sp.]
MGLIVKICGLKTPEALDVALESGADMVGFVFFPPSPRNLGTEAARTLGARVKDRAG